jgi:hypothetical protein
MHVSLFFFFLFQQPRQGLLLVLQTRLFTHQPLVVLCKLQSWVLRQHSASQSWVLRQHSASQSWVLRQHSASRRICYVSHSMHISNA